MSVRSRISHFAARKVPVFSLILVALTGAIGGVLASGLIGIATTTLAGESGTFHDNTGKFTIIDNGLSVTASTKHDNAAGALACGGTLLNVYSNVTAGQWLDHLTIKTSESNSHIVRIIVRDQGKSPDGNVFTSLTTNGRSPIGNVLTSLTTGVWTCTETTTVNLYIGLLTTTVNPPLTIYTTVT